MAESGTDFGSVLLRAWQGQLDLLQLFNAAAGLDAQGLFPLSAVLYQTWLQRNHSDRQQYVYFNLGSALLNAGDLEPAQAAYQKAAELDAGFIQPRFNLGIVQERLGHIADALEMWRWVTVNVNQEDPEQREMLISALNNIGRVQDAAKQYGEAHDCLTRSLQLKPDQPDVLHHWVFIRARQCAWPVYSAIPGVSLEAMRANTSALAMLSQSDDPQAQLEAARNYVRKKLAPLPPPLTDGSRYAHDKIRVAYCSSDFCLHPVAMLTVELFELHDREHFEVYGFCWTREDASPIRQRIAKAFDHFIRIDTLDDEAAARLIREHEIDILIDLHGQTLGARANMLAYRPAPVQITYLGLPATTGLPSIDYVIADRFLIPEESTPFYSEKPLYMPDIYQVSDRKRLCLPPPSRESCGLPVDAFVFCSFNNNYKFTPAVFEVWMRILQQVPHGVLWLLSDNPWAEAKLRREALAHGINPARLIFAPRVAPEAYLARYMAADLFLDTFPFNAGTTANDALWAGLPVLTCPGRTFASRMAGALLTAAGLPELICADFPAYERKAIELANDPTTCRRLHEHLLQQREHGPLFDSPRFVRHLEQHFRRLIHHEN
ncbi:O-linked N-acetylglucosamine transferase, SPINDLY family protein [Uliginosibacterium aquaticum]|uniref:protein O-GlcNAc transferase n=1 Tax=Uliginosibacterium aquaticum TaxID=2731212 RepID=A0ABX2IG06_9RHOO|nr:acetylglucosamine transferase [Uliginosibacterium aquaticum]NSL55412.1 acetylglucosamine transferase [Uliginosibacterium aquaticum]